ncbi:MAG TPA: penicillin-binding transpeptidase domain-containing protein [Candidatus Lumbricidophila sp.]|nr:penicillin-binding transpeptidase domain-containing protein [Candidatus Lumbricidophila sp.]
MNRELRRLSLVVLAMFVSLLCASTVIQTAQQSNLAADPRNVRTLYASYSVERGPILAAGKPIADSVPSGDAYKFKRQYANGPLYAPITGFFPLNGAPTGLEQSTNTFLSGSNDTQFFESLKRLISGLEPAGATVEVSVDPGLQQAAWDALGDLQGAVVVTEPSTGRILAMVSKPTFDPNVLATHDGAELQKQYAALVADPRKPLLNRATGGDMNPPGSTFKLVVVAAALESGKFTPDSMLPNPAEFTLPGTQTVIHNSGKGTCGGLATEQVSIADALRFSCNIPFAELGLQVGAQALREQAQKFGFNSEFQIPTQTEASVFPRVLDEAQTGLASFGQFSVRATPLQMALVSAAIANGGLMMKPSLVDRVLGTDLSPLQETRPSEYGRVMSPETAAALTRMMVANVEAGAASNARMVGVSVAGKTGTAENGDSSPYTLWFTGFAPADSPRYAISVVVEDGGGLGQSGFGNGTAAPIAKKVLEAVLKK